MATGYPDVDLTVFALEILVVHTVRRFARADTGYPADIVDVPA